LDALNILYLNRPVFEDEVISCELPNPATDTVLAVFTPVFTVGIAGMVCDITPLPGDSNNYLVRGLYAARVIELLASTANQSVLACLEPIPFQREEDKELSLRIHDLCAELRAFRGMNDHESAHRPSGWSELCNLCVLNPHDITELLQANSYASRQASILIALRDAVAHAHETLNLIRSAEEGP